MPRALTEELLPLLDDEELQLGRKMVFLQKNFLRAPIAPRACENVPGRLAP